MSDLENIPPPDQLLARLNEQDEALNDTEKAGALRELLRAGISVGKAATHLDLPVSVAWRMVTSDKATQKAMTETSKTNLMEKEQEEAAEEKLNKQDHAGNQYK